MLYQSEDHFIHDRSWKNEIIEDLQVVATTSDFPCISAQKDILTSNFFYSFCCKEQFKNYYQFASSLFLYINSIQDDLGRIKSQQPLIIFFDKNLNRFFKNNPNQLIWEALSYAHDLDSTIHTMNKTAEYSSHNAYKHLYFGGIELCLNIVESSVKYSRGVFDKNLMLIIHPKKNNDARIIKMKAAS
ncbi:YqcI/YcgG family protein [Acinetobacter nectaris]|uniref:YqcI/YcgG family protein n=1 Tax=Acinetobacter nectaris TaxID=1219382 RepID=UPI001F3A2C29|nr:YqcI/YcgG family protein [Acinetobacter nectaris]MCF9033687.1 YqcI/YcgG family protein [Acinetobacter nectaris]